MAIRDQVRQFVTTNFYLPDPRALDDTTSFLQTGIIDSTGVLEIVGFLERDLGLQLRDNEIIPENLDSIANIVNFVERKRSQ
ncbi:MAG TPA: acyl carrier protein [Polyangiaceae bacterium]|jgi:acyl carrier protein